VPLVGVPSLVRKVNPSPSGRFAQRIGPRARGVAALGYVAIVALALFVVGCASASQSHPGSEPGSEPAPGFFPVQPVSQGGQYTYDFYPVVFFIAVVVFLLVEGLLIWIVFRYRRKPSDDQLPAQTHGNNVLEIIWTVIPALIVTALFVFTVNTLGKVQAVSANPALTVDVTAFQWQWTFDYPDQGLSFTGTGRDGPNMVVPVNETVHIKLHSADVIHSFYVPQFLYKLDVVPGRTNEFDVVITQVGTFAGQCAEFCGLGHADMHFTVQAMERADFDAWVTQQQNPPSQEPVATPQPGAQAVDITAISVTAGFDKQDISIPANQPWTVNLTNADPSVPHDFSVRGANPDGSDWIGLPYAPGGGSAVYQPPPLAPGDYQFYCSIHPNMIGTLHVGQ